jgi:hypothetical protein
VPLIVILTFGVGLVLNWIWRLIPNCGDIDSSVPPSASEHRAHIPLDHRTFLQ